MRLVVLVVVNLRLFLQLLLLLLHHEDVRWLGWTASHSVAAIISGQLERVALEQLLLAHLFLADFLFLLFLLPTFFLLQIEQ